MCLSWERTCDKMWLILCACVFFEPSRKAKYPKPLSKVPPNHNIGTIFVKGASHCETRPNLGPLGSLEYRFSASFSHHAATIFPSCSPTFPGQHTCCPVGNMKVKDGQGISHVASCTARNISSESQKLKLFCMDLIWFDWMCGKCQTPKVKGILNSRVSWVDSLDPCSKCSDAQKPTIWIDGPGRMPRFVGETSVASKKGCPEEWMQAEWDSMPEAILGFCRRSSWRNHGSMGFHMFSTSMCTFSRG
jgi:hypothetical protein